ncbi:LSM5 (YER146W) [Zygosaccharomyces parabailii]|uniref:LSM complex subunit LSM5 n=1 Tax=Zygosaccharomyces bailii (strain CLIB 213 / ATCC 58445 / CBS 680 / BCRC 21525 / NBRC 1098 / NCYC 1416 / NRRL Y-2227) TaxID=1333698 RepID=A0A8J2T7D8_ZYGB2|nr:LSM5 (YER146W) [Zygosaccharomyces parabailii]AQZ13611.1 LSM5 (YER146W) [Zygosaccharomyces parabailii]CDF90070.1 ZYBA0S05-08306g1_1 [Zygosaccharomyces bailii CLIB 213]SJM87304.1 probable U6 snRNA-associated Sm-like protein LSm5 [Zygosaccharomyces bailii]
MSTLEVLPLEIIDKTVGQPVWIVLQSNREFTGTLVGFDDFVNVIVEDALEIVGGPNLEDVPVMQHKGRMLLSGNSIAMLVPGGKRA